MVNKTFSKVDELLKAVLAYPRRVICKDNADSIGFEADDGSRFSINLIDYKNDINKANVSYRTGVFAQAMTTKKGKENCCESLNYGKPDFEE